MRTTLLRGLGPLVWLLTLGMPGVLLFTSLRTYRALEAQKSVYLRSRAAAIATQFQELPATVSRGAILRAMDEEPALLEVVILEPPPEPESDPQAALWLGRELFHTERIQVAGHTVFRATLPFHGAEGLRLARIDLADEAADFIVQPARQQLWVAAAASLAYVGLSLLSVWSIRRMLRAEHRQLELEHLAHIGQLAAVLAHEIRNPLGTIKGFAQLLGEQLSPPTTDLVNPILSESERLERLVNDLLRYGRPCQPSPRIITSQEVAERLRPHVEQMRGASGMEWRVHDVTFESDMNLLQQALLNLLKNAFEALDGRNEGMVWLTAEEDHREVVWQVADDGPGLDEEARRRLFEPFHTTKAFGTGLGLSITKKIAESLGGRVIVSARAGGGTAVTLRLPRQSPDRTR